MPAEDNIARLDAHRRRRRGDGPAGGGPSPGTLMLDPKYPEQIAGEFLAARHVDEQERRLLLCQGGVFYRYDGIAYRAIEEARLEHQIYEFARPAWCPTKNGAEPFPADKRKVHDIVHALRALVHVSAEIAPPAWLGEAVPDLAAEDIVSCRNTLLHVPTMSRLPHTPEFFTLNALDFDYEPEAACPHWLRFLEEVLEPEAREQLRQINGYLLTPATDQQKTFLAIGPPRSGKGTVARVLASLLGERNVVAPILSSLATTFGREQLLGKRLALISDARLSLRTDQGPIVETILSISGEDTITIQRKFLPAWSGRLPLRFFMLSNELPGFVDISGAFVSRWIVLRFPNSFLGREDPDLTARLLTELPGILNWALDGLARLRAAGRFVQPRASADLLQRWEDLSSPIKAFLRTECVVDPEAVVDRDVIFGAWKDWCADQGYGRAGSKASFGKHLVANVIGLLDAREPRRVDVAGQPLPRRHLYRGLRLKTEREEAQE